MNEKPKSETAADHAEAHQARFESTGKVLLGASILAMAAIVGYAVAEPTPNWVRSSLFALAGITGAVGVEYRLTSVTLGALAHRGFAAPRLISVEEVRQMLREEIQAATQTLRRDLADALNVVTDEVQDHGGSHADQVVQMPSPGVTRALEKLAWKIVHQPGGGPHN